MFTNVNPNQKRISALPLTRAKKQQLIEQRRMQRNGQLNNNVLQPKKDSRVSQLETQIRLFEEKINLFQKKLHNAKIMHAKLTSSPIIQPDKASKPASSNSLLMEMKQEVDAKKKILEEVKNEHPINKVTKEEDRDLGETSPKEVEVAPPQEDEVEEVEVEVEEVEVAPPQEEDRGLRHTSPEEVEVAPPQEDEEEEEEEVDRGLGDTSPVEDKGLGDTSPVEDRGLGDTSPEEEKKEEILQLNTNKPKKRGRRKKKV